MKNSTRDLIVNCIANILAALFIVAIINVVHFVVKVLGVL